MLFWSSHKIFTWFWSWVSVHVWYELTVWCLHMYFHDCTFASLLNLLWVEWKWSRWVRGSKLEGPRYQRIVGSVLGLWTLFKSALIRITYTCSCLRIFWQQFSVFFLLDQCVGLTSHRPLLVRRDSSWWWTLAWLEVLVAFLRVLH